MSDDSVHNPELPGVRTYKKDIADDTAGFSFGGIKLTVPKQTVEPSAGETPAHNATGGKQLFDVEKAYNDDAVQEGTIVTDRKRRRMSAGNLLKSAFTEWWSKTQHSVEETVDKMEFLKPKEEPKVEAPAARTSIIQEAAKYAKQAPRDDHNVVVEKIRTFAQDAETVTGKPFLLKEEVKGPEGAWGTSEKPEEEKHTAAPVPKKPLPTLDLRETVIAPAVEKRTSTPLASYSGTKTVSKITPPPIQPTQSAKTPSVPISTVPEKMHTKSVEPKKSAGSWAFFEKGPGDRLDMRDAIASHASQETVAPSIPPVSQEKPLPQPPVVHEPVVEPRPKPASPVTFESYIKNVDARTPSIPPSTPLMTPLPRVKNDAKPLPQKKSFPVSRAALYAGIVLVGGALGIFTAFFVAGPFKEPVETAEETTAEPIEVVSFLSTDAQIPLVLPNDRAALLSDIQSEIERNTGTLAQVYFVNDKNEGKPITTSLFMDVLKPRAESSFLRALGQNFMVGSVLTPSREPFLIMQSSNFDVVFAGMLSWEREMSADLAPLFGPPVLRSLVPHGNATTTDARFVDALKSNRSIRILYDETGKERLVYAYVNRSLIIVTTSTEALAKLIERIKK